MQDSDKTPFGMLMKTLSTTFNIELTEMRLHTYWGALRDFPLDAVQWATVQAIKEEPHFPVPLTLRQYARQYRESKLQQAEQHARKQLTQWSETPDEEGVKAIRKVLQMLGDHMEMTHQVYQEPSTDDPDKRRAELLAQAWHLMDNTPNPKED